MDNVVKALRELQDAKEAHKQATKRVDAALLNYNVERRLLDAEIEALAEQ